MIIHSTSGSAHETGVFKEFPWLDGFTQSGDEVVVYDVRGKKLNWIESDEYNIDDEYKEYLEQYLGTRVFHMLMDDEKKTGIRVTVRRIEQSQGRVVIIFIYSDKEAW